MSIPLPSLLIQKRPTNAGRPFNLLLLANIANIYPKKARSCDLKPPHWTTLLYSARPPPLFFFDACVSNHTSTWYRIVPRIGIILHRTSTWHHAVPRLGTMPCRIMYHYLDLVSQSKSSPRSSLTHNASNACLIMDASFSHHRQRGTLSCTRARARARARSSGVVGFCVCGGFGVAARTLAIKNIIGMYRRRGSNPPPPM